jgi:hypothetical protein
MSRAQLDPGSTPLEPAIRLSCALHTPPGSLRRAGLGWRFRMSGDVALAWHQSVTSGFSA